ncbi:MAG TPA: hypothetical protein VN328_06645 [Thermodesulfovibrionales bacterium]|nr:hypothetical protein [Thermodesulfovibrionales bacterium]
MENNPNDSGLDRLFAAARKAEIYEPDKEYGFETRVMANIRAKREVKGSFPFWAWRLMPIFFSIVVFLGIWTYMSESRNQRIDLSAVAGIGSEETMLLAFLTGE